MPNEQTNVQQVEIADIDSWLNAPGADNVVTPASKPANIFSKNTPDLEFLNEESVDENVSHETQTSTEEGTKPEETKSEEVPNLDEILNEAQEEVEEAETQPSKGRPKTEKNALVGYLKTKIENNEMFAFDDYDESKQSIDEYLGSLPEKDLHELLELNIQEREKQVAAKTPQEFFEALPEELQLAARYVMDGGQDLQGLFKALSSVQEVRELNPEDEHDQESIVRQYLQATGFGSDDEIDEELNTWKDLGHLEKKAKQFKPKLDAMQEQIVQEQLARQEEYAKQQQAAAEAYVKNVFEALRPGEIGGLKLDRKVQNELYQGLVKAQYPSINGGTTNKLGHLLEKYQYTEPNYSLIAEVLWLLDDPEGYRNELKKQGKNETVEQTVRTLKTEQSRKLGASGGREEESKPHSRKIAKPKNIFSRS